MENLNDIKPYLRFSVLIAIIQLVSVSSALFLLVDSEHKTGTDAWIAFYVIIPWTIMLITAPLNIFSAPFYFLKYKNDPVHIKIIVSLALITSVWFLLVYGRSMR